MKFTLIQVILLLVAVSYLPEYSSAMPTVNNMTSVDQEMTSEMQATNISQVKDAINYAIVSFVDFKRL